MPKTLPTDGDQRVTIRLLCIAAGDLRNSIIERLVTLADGDVDVRLHIGNDSGDLKATSLSTMSARRGRSGHLMDADAFRAENMVVSLAPGYHERLDRFSEHLIRRSEPYAYKSHAISSPHDYAHYYNILADALADRMKAEGITHVLFFDIPHLGYDTVVHDVAVLLGLRTVIVTQALFPNRFMSMPTPSASGSLAERRKDASSDKFSEELQPSLFYMHGIGQERGEPGRLSAKAVLNFILFLATKRPLRALNLVYVLRILHRMQKIYRKLPKWRDPFARFFHEDELAYFESLTGFEETEIDLSQRFVYFPLQLQPEMTTASLGGVFRDQALAVEALAAMLPSDVKIYVKENPKQGGYMRGPLFFHRLRRISKVVFLPSYANTHALLEASEFVATVTGTVGWEAISSDKTVLAFGKPWYSSLPGVVSYRNGLSYKDVMSTSFSRDQLKTALGYLVSSMHKGVVEKNYAKIVPDFDPEENASHCAEAILGLLRGDTDFVFQDLPAS